MRVDEKVVAIVDALDVNGDGELSADEVRALFAKILGVPAADIPDDHEELNMFVELTGLSREDKVAKLVDGMHPLQIEQVAGLGPGRRPPAAS